MKSDIIKKLVLCNLLFLSTCFYVSCAIETIREFNAKLMLWPEERRGINPLSYVQSHSPIISDKDLLNLIGDVVQAFMSDLHFKDDAKLNKINESTSYIQKVAFNNPENEIAFIGDIHGSIHSLLRILNDLKNKNYLNDNFKIKKSNFYMVFTGDFVDRGLYGAETWYTLMKLKSTNWDNVFLIRGNHEGATQNMQDGFFNIEIPSKYKNSIERMKVNFSSLYTYLPSALYIQVPGEHVNCIQCCHGGIPYMERTFISLLNNFLSSESSIENISKIEADIFLWGDFKKRNDIISCVLRATNQIIWDDVKDFLRESNIKAIFRGHQHLGAGLKMFAQDSTNPGEPVSWEEVVNPTRQASVKQFLIHRYFPVFTFTTATEAGVDEVFYAILKTTPIFNEWTLMPVTVKSFAPRGATASIASIPMEIISSAPITTISKQ